MRKIYLTLILIMTTVLLQACTNESDKPTVKFGEVTIDKGDLTLDLIVEAPKKYQDGIYIRLFNLDTEDYASNETVLEMGLNEDIPFVVEKETNYEIKVYYKDMKKDSRISNVMIDTKPFQSGTWELKPTAQIEIKYLKDYVEFDVSLSNMNQVNGSIIAILKKEDQIISSKEIGNGGVDGTIQTNSFDGLEFNTLYTIEIAYEQDGERIKIGEQLIHSGYGNVTPEINVTSVIASEDKTELELKYEVMDKGKNVESLIVTIMKDQEVIVALKQSYDVNSNNQSVHFSHLEKNVNYTIIIEAQYTDGQTELIHSIPFMMPYPAAIIKKEQSNNIAFSLQVNQEVSQLHAYLYQNSEQVGEMNLSSDISQLIDESLSYSFMDVKPNSLYVVVIKATYLDENETEKTIVLGSINYVTGGQ